MEKIRIIQNKLPEEWWESVFGEARAAGVKILFLTCHVEPDELVVTGAIEG